MLGLDRPFLHFRRSVPTRQDTEHADTASISMLRNKPSFPLGVLCLLFHLSIWNKSELFLSASVKMNTSEEKQRQQMSTSFFLEPPFVFSL